MKKNEDEKFTPTAEADAMDGELVVRAMTYNIHGCVNTNREVNPQAVAHIIDALDVDIVALQEVDAEKSAQKDQAETIAEILNMDYVFFPVEDNGLHAFGLAVLSCFPIRDHYFNLLPSLYPRLNPRKRGAIRVRLHTPEGPIHLFNTHLSLYKLEQRKQLNALLNNKSLVSTVAENEPVLFCGDLNAGLSSKTYRTVSKYLKDVQKALDEQWLPKPTFHARSPFLRIDHMFISHHFTPHKVEVTINPDIRIASDHLPLTAELIMKNNKSRSMVSE
jgi:endonuclease/exonuclease/phosphatase family metal-dependent hydrolase